MSQVTQILSQVGDSSAAEQLVALVYAELWNLGKSKLVREKSGHTLQATALVHEAYLRPADGHQVQHRDSRRHFFAAAAMAMRRILVERVRGKGRIKRGGGLNRLPVDEVTIEAKRSDLELLALDEAREALGDESLLRPRKVTRFHVNTH